METEIYKKTRFMPNVKFDAFKYKDLLFDSSYAGCNEKFQNIRIDCIYGSGQYTSITNPFCYTDNEGFLCFFANKKSYMKSDLTEVSIYEAMPELVPDGMIYNKDNDRLANKTSFEKFKQGQKAANDTIKQLKELEKHMIESPVSAYQNWIGTYLANGGDINKSIEFFKKEVIGALNPGDEYCSGINIDESKLNEGINETNKYDRYITGKDGKSTIVDVYDVLQAFDVKCPALQHLIKKALCTGLRGHKNKMTDLEDIKDSSNRAIELHKKEIHVK